MRLLLIFRQIAPGTEARARTMSGEYCVMMGALGWFSPLFGSGFMADIWSPSSMDTSVTG